MAAGQQDGSGPRNVAVVGKHQCQATSPNEYLAAQFFPSLFTSNAAMETDRNYLSSNALTLSGWSATSLLTCVVVQVRRERSVVPTGASPVSVKVVPAG
jgi:hypothetical protein